MKQTEVFDVNIVSLVDKKLSDDLIRLAKVRAMSRSTLTRLVLRGWVSQANSRNSTAKSSANAMLGEAMRLETKLLEAEMKSDAPAGR